MRASIGFTVLVSLFLTGVSGSYAQGGSTGISGKVLLPDSMPATGAKVIARHLPTGTLFAAIADTAGKYLIPGIDTGGPYTLEVSLEGYETFAKTDIYLTLSASVIDVGLAKKEGKGVKSTGIRQDDSFRNLAGNRRNKVRPPGR
jgi:hypothetical protein